MESKKIIRSFGIHLPLMIIAISISDVHAQGESLPPPPVRTSIDSNGVDMITGSAGVGGMAVSIGTQASGLESKPGRRRYSHDNYTGTLTGAGYSHIQIDTLGYSEKFNLSGGVYINVKDTGSMLSCDSNTCTYTTSDGTVVLFDKNIKNGFYNNGGLQTKITRPDGEVINISYLAISNYTGYMPSAVSSSLGWMIKYYFGPKSDTTTVNGYNNTLTVLATRSIKAVNTSIEYCSPTTLDCNGLVNVWPISTMNIKQILMWSQLSPTATSEIVTSSVTNAANKSDSYSKSSSNPPFQATNESHRTPSGISRGYYIPGCANINGACTTTTITGKVNQLTVGGTHIFNYDWTLWKGPDGRFGVNFETSRPNYFIDNLNRKTVYTYTDQLGTYVDKIIDPDATPSVDAATGGYTDYDYIRGNIKTISKYPKNGGTPIVSSASYPTVCSNVKTCNKPDSVTNELGITTAYTYDPNHGGITSETKPAVNGVQAQINYGYEQKTPYVKDSSGNLVASPSVWRLVSISKCMTMTLATCVGTADEYRIEYSDFTNNLLSRKTTIKNGNGSVSLTTTKEYDIYGNVTWEDGPKPGDYDATYYFYDALRNVVGTIGIDPDGTGPLLRQASRTGYNDDGVVSSIEKGVVYGTSRFHLDAMIAKEKVETQFSPTSGLPVKELYYAAGELESVTQKSYDGNFRLECVAQRMNRAAFNSLPTSACDPGAAGDEGNDRITKTFYDLTGSVTKVVSGLNTSNERDDRVKTYYSNNGLLETERDGKGNTTSYKYDDFKRLWKVVYPQKTNGAFESPTDYVQTNYTGAKVSSVRLRDGQVVNFPNYDELGRLKTKSGALSETYVYDNFDQVTTKTNTISGVLHTSVYNYNSLGWINSETRQVGGSALGSVSYGYDNYGRRSRLTWPDNFYITYDYDFNGYAATYLQKIKESNGNVLVSFVYDDSGRKKTLTRGNNVITSYGYYDKWSQLKSLTTDVGGTSVADDIAESFIYGVTGQIKSRTLSVANSNYIYNVIAAPAINYTPNSLNQITAVDTQSILYDDRGNLATDNTNNTTYTYNANNLMLTATTTNVTTTLSYDAENRLHSISKGGATTKFLYDGKDLIAEADASNNILRRYIHGAETDDPLVWYEGAGISDKRYYTADRQGSIVGITLQSGMSTSVNAYDEYGIQRLSSVGRFQYTGQAWLAELGLYYYKARFYNPRLGRFMQADPLGYADGMNWYAYLANDPVNLNDPSGMYACEPNMSKDQCATFLDAQNEAIVQIEEAMEALKTIQSKLNSGEGELDETEQAVADRVALNLGNARLGTINSVISSADKMLNVLKGNAPARFRYSPGIPAYAITEEGGVTLTPVFFKKTDKNTFQNQASTVAHEAAHLAIRPYQDPTINMNGLSTPIYGQDAVSFYARKYGTQAALLVPDALTLALGVHRDDD